ncbi:hypothetical protein NMYAN_20381 [Nitrosomonas nitrosa]|uniref:Uncharacterized protein n=1 Tax=Nitrosomonas nitrosa TaxID=52442 RepID=A0A8H9DAC3_9PROT|nr:hypothetical protein NMYAN_20381 [Nitrosomonas nitrosa]
MLICVSYKPIIYKSFIHKDASKIQNFKQNEVRAKNVSNGSAAYIIGLEAFL